MNLSAFASLALMTMLVFAPSRTNFLGVLSLTFLSLTMASAAAVPNPIAKINKKTNLLIAGIYKLVMQQIRKTPDKPASVLK
jgi:hypothetical protein